MSAGKATATGEPPVVFGPVPSRRLGRSLGINHIPPKSCSYSCVYCQLGPTRRKELEPRPFRAVRELVREVARRVDVLRAMGESPDFLTFVPDGEPTLDAHLGEMLARLRRLGTPLAVLSNGSLAWREDVRRRLSLADWVSFKVDAGDERTWRRVDRPPRDLPLALVQDGMLRFRRGFRGVLTTETMLIRGRNDSDEAIESTAAFLERLRPDRA
jgi:wyosine [tRNA(Phe)-imidazoG37] synthetase (radical SAM superfamily)